MSISRTFGLFFAVSMVFSIVSDAVPLPAQRVVQDRIERPIERSSSVVVKGNLHPLAKVQNDRGSMSATFRMGRVTMMFKPTDQQQAELNALLEQQQDPGSANYHQWLSPEQFAERFGLSDNDVNKVGAWLEGQGFTVDEVSRGHLWVAFSGTVGQVETAFRTSIHRYSANGQTFYANSTEPSVPASLAGVVTGFRSLNSFRLQPKLVKRTINGSLSPRFTSNITGNHYLSPNDFATIYDLTGIYSSGLDGTGQTIAVAGQTDIQLSDIDAFRAASGLPANDPQVVLLPGVGDPGLSEGDLGEADLDLEWSGAIAPKAHILFVNSDDAFMSLQYAVDQNLAPVVSVSYGECEKYVTGQDLQMLSSTGQQANAQGITLVGVSGDSGAADCEDLNATIATHGLSVDMPGSLPYITALGGTEFKESASSWSATNNAENGSALSYLPEVAWNDTDSSGLSASGGGRSVYFSKPSWQTGTGVPNDSSRDIPDISLSASPNHDGYLICSGGSCVNGYRDGSGDLTVVGGTSVGAPSFAGVVALINQKTGTRQGNINPILYSLAATTPSAFHDITSGTNEVPCLQGSPDCPSTGVLGYSAGPGYDLVTGLGSTDVGVLMTAWVAPGASTTATSGSSGSASSGAGSSSSGSTSGSGSTSTGTSGSSSNPVAPQPIPVVEQGSIQSGYMIITPDSSSMVPTPSVTFGIVSNGVVLSQAGVTLIPMLNDGSIYADVIPEISRNLGVAMVNYGSAANTVTLTLRDSNGNAVGNPVTVSLAPQQQMARFINELFSASVIGSSFQGSLRVQGTSPVGVLGLRFAGLEVSTLPVAVTTTTSANTPFVVPQFALGGGWATQLALVNNSSATVTGRIAIFDVNGNPLSVALNGVTQSSFSYSIPASGTFVLAPRDVNGLSPF